MVIVGKTVSPFFQVVSHAILFKHAGKEGIHDVLKKLYFGQIGPSTTELAAPGRLETFPYANNGENGASPF